jgi:hypothetical protein
MRELTITRAVISRHSFLIVRRTRSLVGEDCYDLLTNNCEHFCDWWLRAEHRSHQVDEWLSRPGGRYGRLSVLSKSCSGREVQDVQRLQPRNRLPIERISAMKQPIHFATAIALTPASDSFGVRGLETRLASRKDLLGRHSLQVGG